jgi:hypothetical protein
MNPPSTPPRPRTVPPFRSFISVELPFTLVPTVVRTAARDATAACALPAESKSAVEAFLPPPSVAECVQYAAPQRTSMQPRDVFAKRSGGRDAPPPHLSAGNEGATKPLEVFSNNNSSSDGDNDDDVDDDNESRSNHSASTGSGRGSDGESSAPASEVRLLTRHRRDYCTDPIFTVWRSTSWEAEGQPSMSEKETQQDGTRGGTSPQHRMANSAAWCGSTTSSAPSETKRRRLDVFPSIQPQVLLHGYYRNDLLVQVRRTRHIRRYRDPVTNAVLREELVESETDGNGGTLTAAVKEADNLSSSALPVTSVKSSSSCSGGGGDVAASPTLVAEVLGVVSREVELARPADFTFALFTPEQLRASPSLCGADFFPPAHLLSAKAAFEVRYEPGKEANTSVVANDHGDAAAATTFSPSAQWELGVLPTISVGPEETVAGLPSRLPAHDDFLRSLPSSLDGSGEDDPPEVRLMVRLLAERPAWIVQDLMDAMLQSGLCPRTYRNKQVMNCFTYVIRSGPFNRLRLRLDYDPYANSRSAMYERVAVRLHRRSDIGVRLRDVSRSPLTENVLRLLLERDRVRRVAYKTERGHEHRSTLLELQCRAIREGLLVLPYQLVDAMDDAVISDIVRHVAAVDVPMERSQRGQRRGWLSDAAYTRAMTHFTESLVALLEQEVEPLLRKFKGDNDTAHTQKQQQQRQQTAASGSGGAAASLAQPRTDMDHDDDDDDDSLSAMSSATAGDLSSGDEE